MKKKKRENGGTKQWQINRALSRPALSGDISKTWPLQWVRSLPVHEVCGDGTLRDIRLLFRLSKLLFVEGNPVVLKRVETREHMERGLYGKIMNVLQRRPGDKEANQEDWERTETRSWSLKKGWSYVFFIWIFSLCRSLLYNLALEKTREREAGGSESREIT